MDIEDSAAAIDSIIDDYYYGCSLATQSQGHAKTTHTVETDYIAYMNM